jgi:putative heme-binding domain-containing protein
LRREVTEILLAQPDRILSLLREMGAGRVKPGDLDPLRARQLVKHGRPEIRDLARKLLEESLPAERKQVLERYQAALTLKADPGRGREVFRKHCATCHRVAGVGVDVGPDVSDTRTKTPEGLLTDILNPNQAIDANYINYLVTTKAGKVLKAQRIDAEQLDVKNDEREQQVIATGPGEVRILQLGAKDVVTQPRPAAPGRPAPAAEQEMKLTLVRFPSRMVGRDKNKLYQEAVFDDGGRVWQVPTENLNLQVIDHAPPEQWMVAQGNAMFRDDKYQGNANVISDDGRVTTLTGSDKRLAQLYQLRVNPNERQFATAQQIKYYRDGRIEVSGSGSGAIRSGP